MGDPICFVPLGMTYIRVFGSIVGTGPQPRILTGSASAGSSSQKCLTESTASRFQASGHSEPAQMTSSTFSRAAKTSAIQESAGIPDDFEVQQPRIRSSKRRRTSGGQNVDDQTEPNAALSPIKNLVMENIRDRVAFNQITEEFCQMEKLHTLEVAAEADRAYSSP